MKRISTDKKTSLIVQPTFLIGTYNEDDSPNFAPITWICEAYNTDHDIFVANMYGKKQTKINIARTGLLSANLVSCDMLELLDFFGAHTGLEAKKDALPYDWSDGEKVHAPTLDVSRFVYELEVERTIEICENTTQYHCGIRNAQWIEPPEREPDRFINLMPYDPVIYSGAYHSLKECLGTIGDFYTKG